MFVEIACSGYMHERSQGNFRVGGGQNETIFLNLPIIPHKGKIIGALIMK